MSRAWLFVFNTRSYIYSKCKSPFTPKSVMNKPQAEGKVNHVCTVERRRLNTLTFTFMHLADAFIQSDLRFIKAIYSGYTFFLSVHVFPRNRSHNLLRCWRNALPLSHTGTLQQSYLKSFLLISMVELDHQRSAANTLVNKMGLYTFMLFNIFNYCRFASYSEFAFHGFN